MTSATGKPPRPRGFTLLEVLVATTVLGLVTAALVGAFHAGLQAYRLGEQRGALLAQARGALHLLADDTARMVPVALPACRCAADEFTFLTRGERPLAAPSWVTYQWSGGQLSRCEKPLSGAPTKGLQTAVLLGDTCRVQFEYLVHGHWVAQHEVQRHGEPEAVRVRGVVGAETDGVPLCTALRLATARPGGDRDGEEPRERPPRT
jgi:prepilin-type N-terminal cleavage/methylation domain-containing protein